MNADRKILSQQANPEQHGGGIHPAVYKNESSAIRIFTPLMKVNQPEWEGKRRYRAKLAVGSADSVPPCCELQ